MREAQILSIVLISLAGCGGLSGLNVFNSVKVDNPVVGPPPPRVERPYDRLTSDEPVYPDTNQVRQVRHDPQTGQLGSGGDELSGSQVVASVMGAPIFASEVLERYALKLSRVQDQYPPAQYRELRKSLLIRDLPVHIERKLLVQSLRSTLQKEQIEMFEKHLDGLFLKEVDRLKQELGVNSTHELETKLKNEQKTSLSNLRDAFANQRMAMEYLATKSKPQRQIGRPDLLRYYDDHLDDYAIPAQVKWQQVLIDFNKHGGKRRAFEIVENVVQELKNNADVGDVARRYSNGPKASRGGHWDWIPRGSLNNRQIEKMLFELPVGKISQVIVGEHAYHLVKTNAREQAGFRKFEEVQDGIEKHLRKEMRAKSTQKVLDELRENAVIETIFDG